MSNGNGFTFDQLTVMQRWRLEQLIPHLDLSGLRELRLLVNSRMHYGTPESFLDHLTTRHTLGGNR